LEKAIEIKRRAQRCIQNGDLDGALNEYEKLVQAEDSDPYNFVLLADLQFKRGDADQAVQRYLAAVGSYEKAGLYKNAIAVCKKMMRLSLAPAKVLERLAALHALDGLGTEAALYYMQYAETLVRDGKPAEAAGALQKAFDASPDEVKALERMSEAWMLADDTAQAARAMGAAAYAYERLGRLDQVERCRKRAEQLHAGTMGGMVAERGALRGIVVETKGGRQILPGTVVVDTTGDADVAARAGAPFELGRAEDGRLQPVSRIFHMGNVHLDRVYAYLRQHPEEFTVPEGWTPPEGRSYGADYLEETPGTSVLLQRVVQQAQQEGRANLPKNVISIYTPPYRSGPAEVALNATRIHGIDPTDPDELTRAELECERQVMDVFRFLKTTIPGFEESRLLGTPYQVGVRESRRIIGEYMLTVDDVLRGADFPDAVARGAYPLDIHDVAGLTRYAIRKGMI